MITNIPSWLRWLILLPVSILGGFVAGYGIYQINSYQAATPNAPIVYVADFLGGFASNYVALYLAHEIAPSAKRTIVSIFLVIGVLASFGAIYYIFRNQTPTELIGVAGDMAAIFIIWKKFVK